jgi:hypothetical protein
MKSVLERRAVEQSGGPSVRPIVSLVTALMVATSVAAPVAVFRRYSSPLSSRSR